MTITLHQGGYVFADVRWLVCRRDYKITSEQIST